MSDLDQTSAHRKPSSGALIVVGIILALIGLALSGYTLNHHLLAKAVEGTTNAACNINATFNCDAVARSEFSEPFGIPLGVYGIGFFASLLVLLILPKIKPETEGEALHTYSALVVVGLISSIVLFLISEFKVGVLCPACLGIYGVNVGQAILLFTQRKAIPSGWSAKTLTNGGTYAVIVVCLAVIGFNYLKPTSRDLKLDVPQTEEALKAAQLGSILSPQKTDLPLDLSRFSGFGEDMRQGNDQAKVTVVEFADFQCPACRSAHELFKQIKSEFGDQILFVFKNYPLDNTCNSSIGRKFHEYACEAARYARCAAEGGKYWQMHDLIYERQKELNSANLVAWSTELGLNQAQMKECVDRKDILDKIRSDVELGNKAGVDSTPTIFINNRKVVGDRSPDAIRKEIQKLLNE